VFCLCLVFYLSLSSCSLFLVFCFCLSLLSVYFFFVFGCIVSFVYLFPHFHNCFLPYASGIEEKKDCCTRALQKVVFHTSNYTKHIPRPKRTRPFQKQTKNVPDLHFRGFLVGRTVLLVCVVALSTLFSQTSYVFFCSLSSSLVECCLVYTGLFLPYFIA
jgi:hypothetical protein